jgi:hypothetical protein
MRDIHNHHSSSHHPLTVPIMNSGTPLKDTVVKAKIDELKLGEFSDMSGASTLLTWKEAISIPQQGS